MEKYFNKEIIYSCYDEDFNNLVLEAYGHQIEIQAEEQYLYGSSLDYNIGSELREYQMKSFESFKETGKYPGTNTLLSGMCYEGLIKEGKYLIKCGS